MGEDTAANSGKNNKLKNHTITILCNAKIEIM